MIRAAEQALAQHVRINWDLIIHWAPRHFLSFPGLVGLFDKDLPPEDLPDRVAEMRDLFGRLFHDYDQITFSRLLWRKERRAALEILAYSQDKEEQFVVTCGCLEDNRLERELARFAPQASDAGSASIKLAAETMHYAATALAMGGTAFKEIQSFAAFYQSKPDKQTRPTLEHLFRATLSPWHQQGLSEESKRLDRLYRERLGLTENVVPPVELECKMQALAKEAFARNLAEIAFPPHLVEIRFPGGRSISCPDPIPYLYHDEMLPAPRTICGTTPGGLDVNTVLVDSFGRTWLSDFAQAGPAPIWHDFVSLETAIRFELVDAGNLQTLYDLEKRLLATKRLSETVSLDDIEPEYKKASSAIQTIRRLASDVGGDDPGPYYIGLLFCTAKGLTTYDPALKQTKPEITGLLHRILFMAMLCEKMDQLKSTPEDLGSQAPKRLRMDEANREVWVGEKQVPLTNTEFDLLLYLYHHAGELCKRSDIAQDVFDLKGANRDAEDSLLNTNIGRLRDKIESDPSFPEYVVTIRGQGYKLLKTDTLP
jgi:hypothetical protein